ncbi:MAG: hypothetical protein ABIP74_04390 [Candidatus Saccharimonas sp.]
MPAMKSSKKLESKQKKRDSVVDRLVANFKFFRKPTDDQIIWATTYLDGEGPENELLYRLLVDHARKNKRAREHLLTLCDMKPRSVGAQRASRILSAALDQ